MDIQIYKTKLEEEKKLLTEELGSLGKVDKTGDWEANDTEVEEVQDEADMAERTEDYEERSIKLNTLELRLADINKALEKIEGDSYGMCEVCGKEIEEERLTVNPAAKTCEVCMNKII